MAVMRGTRRGAFRSGRYATRSRRTAISVETAMETMKTTPRLRIGMPIQETGRGESGGNKIGRVGPAHEHLAVGEVDHPEDPVDHGVAHGDEGIDAPLGQPEDDEIKPVMRLVAPRGESCGGSPDDQQQDRPSGDPHEKIGNGDPLPPVL